MSVPWINCSQVCTDASEQGWLLEESKAEVFTNVHGPSKGKTFPGFQFRFLFPATQKLVTGQACTDRREALHDACMKLEKFLK